MRMHLSNECALLIRLQRVFCCAIRGNLNRFSFNPEAPIPSRWYRASNGIDIQAFGLISKIAHHIQADGAFPEKVC